MRHIYGLMAMSTVKIIEYGAMKHQKFVVKASSFAKRHCLVVVCVLVAFLGRSFLVQTVTSEHYLYLLTVRCIRDAYHEHCIHSTWFQLDGASTHSIRDVLALLRIHYDNRFIWRGFPNRFHYGIFSIPIALTYQQYTYFCEAILQFKFT